MSYLGKANAFREKAAISIMEKRRPEQHPVELEMDAPVAVHNNSSSNNNNNSNNGNNNIASSRHRRQGSEPPISSSPPPRPASEESRSPKPAPLRPPPPDVNKSPRGSHRHAPEPPGVPPLTPSPQQPQRSARTQREVARLTPAEHRRMLGKAEQDLNALLHVVAKQPASASLETLQAITRQLREIESKRCDTPEVWESAVTVTASITHVLTKNTQHPQADLVEQGKLLNFMREDVAVRIVEISHSEAAAPPVPRRSAAPVGVAAPGRPAPPSGPPSTSAGALSSSPPKTGGGGFLKSPRKAKAGPVQTEFSTEEYDPNA